MKVLFSSVGKSDPMTIFENKDIYDGSYLHIIRNNDIEKVYLYMSKEICGYDESDNRYLKAIELYNEQFNKKVEVIKIYRDELVDVQKFDIFYEDFENIIKNIIDDCGKDVEILCNVSSGTPAMKSTLQVISALSPYKLVPIQVIDPSKGRYKRDVDLNNYDIDYYWTNNIDNLMNENRTYLSNNESFNFKIQKEMIISLINSYDYDAAYKLISDYKYRINKEIVDLIEFAFNRNNLDVKEIVPKNKKYGWNLLPYRDMQNMKLFEYFLWLNIKVKKEEIVDFVRGLNPFMHTACHAIVKKMGINIYSYCVYEKNTYKLKIDLLKKDALGSEILDILNASYYKGYDDSKFLSEEQLMRIINSKLSGNKSLVNALNELDELRTKKRNIASHEIVSIRSKDILKDLGNDVNYYLGKMKIILRYLNYDIDQYCDSYEQMNKYICDKVKQII